MLRKFQRVGAWIGYRLTKAYWWIFRPVVLGVRVLITDGNEVLLVRHTYREGWFLPGGRPNKHESLSTTARREVREETEVHVEPRDILGVYSTISGGASDHVVVFHGHSSSSMPQDPKSLSAEVDAVRWASACRLPGNTAVQTRRIIEDWQSDTVHGYRVVEGKRGTL
jgi:8-oxo-dGTP pyrophosphatase MutT (NUDIX family)